MSIGEYRRNAQAADARSALLKSVVRKQRLEIIALEKEVGDLCKTIQSLRSELTLVKKDTKC